MISLSGLTFSDVSYVYKAYCCYIAFILDISLEILFMVTCRQIPTVESKFDFWLIRKHFQTYVFQKCVFQQQHSYLRKCESFNWHRATTQVFATKMKLFFLKWFKHTCSAVWVHYLTDIDATQTILKIWVWMLSYCHYTDIFEVLNLCSNHWSFVVVLWWLSLAFVLPLELEPYSISEPSNFFLKKETYYKMIDYHFCVIGASWRPPMDESYKDLLLSPKKFFAVWVSWKLLLLHRRHPVWV